MIIKENTKEALNSSQAVSTLINSILRMESEIDRDKEHFFAIGVNAKNGVKFVDLVTLGTLTNSLVHPRETFRLAVNRGCASIIVAHNHPSGDPTPSKDDMAVTTRLKQAGEILGIQLLDHVIVGSDNQYVSLREKGLL